jgi:hypothetical protein
MSEHEPGPLEREISDAMHRTIAGDPTALEMLTGLMGDADFQSLTPDERRLRIASVQERIIQAQRDAILRLAREIDAINADHR